MNYLNILYQPGDHDALFTFLRNAFGRGVGDVAVETIVADTYVKLVWDGMKDPNEIVKVGQKIKVRVLEVDVSRKRISLSAKSDAPPKTKGNPSQDREKKTGQRPNQARSGSPKNKPAGRTNHRSQRPQKSSSKKSNFSNNPFAALKNLKG